MLNDLIQDSLCILLVWAVCRAFPRVSPTVRCWLWRLVALRCVVAMVVSVPITTSFPSDKVPAMVDASRLVTSKSLKVIAATNTVTFRPSDEEIQREADRVIRPRPSIPWLLLTYLSGLILNLGMIWLSWRRSVEIVQAAQLTEAPNFAHARPRASFRVSADVDCPAVTGLAMPVVLLPQGEKEGAATQAAVLHELAHVRRHDLRWTLAMSLWRALFWFNPLAWLAEREHRIETEICADTLARAWMDESPRIYGKSILAWVSTPTDIKHSPSLLLSTEQLQRRLKALGVRRYSGAHQVVLCACLGLPMLGALIPSHFALKLPTIRQDWDSTLALRVPARSGEMRVLLSKKYPDAQIDAITSAHDLNMSPNPVSVAACKQLQDHGTGGPVVEADLPTGEKIRLLGVSSLDPDHAESWAADGTPLRFQLPFSPTYPYVHRVAYTEVDDKGHSTPMPSTSNFVRQVLVEFRSRTVGGVQGSMRRLDSSGQPVLSITPSEGTAIAGLPKDELANNLGTYRTGRLETIEQPFPAEAKAADLDISWELPSTPLGRFRSNGHRGPFHAVGATWRIYRADELHGIGTVWDEPTKMLVCVCHFDKPDAGADYLRVMNMQVCGEFSNGQRVGSPAYPMPSARLSNGTYQAKPGSFYWLLQDAKLHELQSISIVQAHSGRVRFKNVQLHPIGPKVAES